MANTGLKFTPELRKQADGLLKGGMRVSDVAMLCNVSAPTIYRHFPGRGAINGRGRPTTRGKSKARHTAKR